MILRKSSFGINNNIILNKLKQIVPFFVQRFLLKKFQQNENFNELVYPEI